MEKAEGPTGVDILKLPRYVYTLSDELIESIVM